MLLVWQEPELYTRRERQANATQRLQSWCHPKRRPTAITVVPESGRLDPWSLTGASASSSWSGSKLSTTWAVAARDSRLSRTDDCTRRGMHSQVGEKRGWQAKQVTTAPKGTQRRRGLLRPWRRSAI